MDEMRKPGCERAPYWRANEIFVESGWTLDSECPICHEEYGRGDLLIFLYHHRNRQGVGSSMWSGFKSLLNLDDAWDYPTPHAFHYACLGQWVRTSDQCPMCRQPVDCEMIRDDFRPGYFDETAASRYGTSYVPRGFRDAGAERMRYLRARNHDLVENTDDTPSTPTLSEHGGGGGGM